MPEISTFTNPNEATNIDTVKPAKKPITKWDKAIAITLLVVISAVLITSGVYLFLINKPKAISVFNNYAEELKIYINNSEVKLTELQNYSTEINTNKVKFEAKNLKDDVIFSEEKQFGNSAGIWHIYLSPQAADGDADTTKACYLNANIASLIYKFDDVVSKEGKVGEPTEINVLSSDAVTNFYEDFGVLGSLNSLVTYSGKLDYNTFPDEIEKTDKLITSVPVVCTTLEDIELIDSQIRSFIDFETNYTENLQTYKQSLIDAGRAPEVTQ